MIERALDIGALLALLARHEVDYLIIGGVAVQAHGHRRTTRDLDVLPSPADRNHERLAAALAEAGARPAGLPGAPSPSPDQLRVAAVVPPLVTAYGEIHVLNAVPGARPYDEMRRRALLVRFEGVELAIVSRDDLLSMKRATGRPEDLADVEALTALERHGGL